MRPSEVTLVSTYPPGIPSRASRKKCDICHRPHGFTAGSTVRGMGMAFARFRPQDKLSERGAGRCRRLRISNRQSVNSAGCCLTRPRRRRRSIAVSHVSGNLPEAKFLIRSSPAAAAHKRGGRTATMRSRLVFKHIGNSIAVMYLERSCVRFEHWLSCAVVPNLRLRPAAAISVRYFNSLAGFCAI